MKHKKYIVINHTQKSLNLLELINYHMKTKGKHILSTLLYYLSSSQQKEFPDLSAITFKFYLFLIGMIDRCHLMQQDFID